LTRKFTYANAGVNRKLRAESKKALQILRKTYSFSRYGEVVPTNMIDKDLEAYEKGLKLAPEF